MKIRRVNEELIQQILYALLGLAFIATLFVSAQAHSSELTSVGVNDGITLSGEITSIEGEGFSLKHDNGMTLVSLKELEKESKTALQQADIIKVGNKVTVKGELEKGSFNNPVVMANNIIVTEKADPSALRVVPTPVVPKTVTVTPVDPSPSVTVVPPAE